MAILTKKLSEDSLQNLYSCYLFELPEAEKVMLAFIRLILLCKVDKQYDFGDTIVLRVAQIGKLLFREKHRFEAFVRFQRLKDDLYFSANEPDFNVLPLKIKHFQNRYADQKWLIYDCHRKYGIFYDLAAVSEVQIEEQSDHEKISEKELNPQSLHPEEDMYQILWKEYYKSVNINTRNNLKLHIQHIPIRYWRYLPEKKLKV